jgi:hypothetical protein
MRGGPKHKPRSSVSARCSARFYFWAVVRLFINSSICGPASMLATLISSRRQASKLSSEWCAIQSLAAGERFVLARHGGLVALCEVAKQRRIETYREGAFPTPLGVLYAPVIGGGRASQRVGRFATHMPLMRNRPAFLDSFRRDAHFSGEISSFSPVCLRTRLNRPSLLSNRSIMKK